MFESGRHSRPFQLAIIRQFLLRWRDVADRLQQSAVIEPVDPFQRGILDGIEGTPRGASETCYSLIETAKANGLEPYAYLHHVLQHIAAADTLEKIEALLPWNMK